MFIPASSNGLIIKAVLEVIDNIKKEDELFMRTSLKKHLILLIIFSMVMALAVGCAPKAEGPS